MFNEGIDYKSLNWCGEIIVTNFDQNNIDEIILEKIKNNKNSLILHIHYSVNYASVTILFSDNDKGCFRCFEKQYNQNKGLIISDNSKKFYISNINYKKEMKIINDIIKIIVNNLKKNSSKKTDSYIVWYKSLKIEKVNIIKLENCCFCKTMVNDYKLIFNLDEEFFYDFSSFRIKKDLPITEMKSFLHNHTYGLFQAIYKYYDSHFIPMVCSEFNDVTTGNKIRSFGRSFNMKNIEILSMLEALERYSGMIPRKKKSIINSNYFKIKNNAINPEKFILNYDKNIEKFGYEKYNPEKNYNWIWAYSWKNEKNVLIPEQIAYFDINKYPDKRFVYETSNGIAIGGSLQEAILYGLFEVIERDAFLLSWYNRYKPKKIKIESIKDKKILEIIKIVEFSGYKIHIFDITTENLVPSIWALIENPNANAKVKSYSAAGTHINPYKAIESALVEIITSMPVYEKILPLKKEKASFLNENYDKVNIMEDHVLLYSIDASFDNLKYLFENEVYKNIDEIYTNWNNKKNINQKSLTKILKKITERILKFHDDIIIVDQSNDLTKKFGFYCVKVIIPSMQTMFFGEQFKRLNIDRIKNGAVYSGWREKPILESDINKAPHPFP